MRRHVAYLRYVLRHKWFVLLACRDLRLSLYQAIIHDWSKFLPCEWFPYARNFYNPNGSKRIDADYEAKAFKFAWLHHQKLNPHHWQYWVLNNDSGKTEALEMPEAYAREMVADWIGAGRAITGRVETRSWYERNKEHMTLHPATRSFIEGLLP